jgi:hypothetical protein
MNKFIEVGTGLIEASANSISLPGLRLGQSAV